MRRALAAGLLALAACTGGAPVATDPSTAPPSAPSGSPGRTVPAALRFTAPAVGGGTVRGAELAGRDVAVWLWAPW